MTTTQNMISKHKYPEHLKCKRKKQMPPRTKHSNVHTHAGRSLIKSRSTALLVARHKHRRICFLFVSVVSVCYRAAHRTSVVTCTLCTRLHAVRHATITYPSYKCICVYGINTHTHTPLSPATRDATAHICTPNATAGATAKLLPREQFGGLVRPVRRHAAYLRHITT